MPTEPTTDETKLDCIAAYLESALDALDNEEIFIAAACIRRSMQYLMAFRGGGEIHNDLGENDV